MKKKDKRGGSAKKGKTYRPPTVVKRIPKAIEEHVDKLAENYYESLS